MLDGDVLGLTVHDIRQQFNNKKVGELMMMYGSLDAARLALTKLEMAAIINHFKTYGVLKVPGTGLTAPNGPVGGQSTTGKIE